MDETNELLLRDDRYIRPNMTTNQYLTLDKLKDTLSGYVILDDDLLKTAILATGGKTRNVLLFLLQQAPREIQYRAFLKNRSLLKDYPHETLDPYVIAYLIHNDASYINDLYNPALFAKTLKQYDISSMFNQPTIRKIIKSDPTLVDHFTWKSYITKDMLLQLGYHTVFTIPEMLEDLGETVGLIALCHGHGYKKIVSTCSITRFMQPWTTCSFINTQQKINIFEKMVARKDILEDEFMVYPSIPMPKNTVVLPEHRADVEHLKELTKDMDSPLIHSFEVGQTMLGKSFSDSSDLKYDGFQFLLIKGKTKTFNLFSLQHTWEMEEILKFLPNKHLIFLDYSCSGIDPIVSVSPEELKNLGGKRRKTRKTRRSRRK